MLTCRPPPGFSLDGISLVMSQSSSGALATHALAHLWINRMVKLMEQK